jgi:hypothetical protein
VFLKKKEPEAAGAGPWEETREKEKGRGGLSARRHKGRKEGKKEGGEKGRT